MSDHEQCLNQLQLYLISFLVNFSYELGQIMTRYDFQETRWVNLSNVWTDSNLTQFRFWSTYHVHWGKYWPDRTSYGLDEWLLKNLIMVTSVLSTSLGSKTLNTSCLGLGDHNLRPGCRWRLLGHFTPTLGTLGLDAPALFRVPSPNDGNKLGSS